MKTILHRRLLTQFLTSGLVCVALVSGMRAVAQATGSPASLQTAGAGETSPSQPIVLDHVIAIINGDVLLDSDVQEEMHFSVLQPFSVPQGQNTRQRATERIINRTLILQQMREAQQLTPVTDEEVAKNLDDLRKQIPACGRYHCATQAGWDAFLKDNGMTQAEVDQRWRQRLEILNFISVRFRAGMRIPKADIEDYYQKTLVPVFAKENQKPPSVESLTPRIEEILLQEHVNVLLRDWLKSLRSQGTVQILDAAYGQNTGDDDNGGE